MKRLASLACAAVFIAGCSPIEHPVSLSAALLVPYPPEFQKQAAKELEAIKPIAPNVATMIVDYGKLRNAIRKAQ